MAGGKVSAAELRLAFAQAHRRGKLEAAVTEGPLGQARRGEGRREAALCLVGDQASTTACTQPRTELIR